MKTSTTDPATPANKERGIFKRMFQKLDEGMKKKADQKSQSSNCSGKDKKGGGKCC